MMTSDIKIPWQLASPDEAPRTMSNETVRDLMREMGEQADPIREALRRMLAEFGDEHYHLCPANFDGGVCDCFAGALIVQATAALVDVSTPGESQ